jgi:hypothetical protein
MVCVHTTGDDIKGLGIRVVVVKQVFFFTLGGNHNGIGRLGQSALGRHTTKGLVFFGGGIILGRTKGMEHDHMGATPFFGGHFPHHPGEPIVAVDQVVGPPALPADRF